MKPAWFLSILLAVPALAQSPTPHGTRIGQVQTEYLESDSSAAGARMLQILEAVRSAGASPIGSGSSALKPRDRGPHVEFETWVEQLSRDYAESVVTGETGVEREPGKATIHRFVRDNFRHTEQTYTTTLETIPGTETFRVSFSDSAIPYPVPQILRDGETIALNLASDARTGRRMVEYIRVGTGVVKPRQQVARDVYAEDAELTIAQPRLRTNGVEQPAGGPAAALSAPVVWVDIPGQGRFDLSFKPRAAEGFERAKRRKTRSCSHTPGTSSVSTAPTASRPDRGLITFMSGKSRMRIQRAL